MRTAFLHKIYCLLYFLLLPLNILAQKDEIFIYQIKVVDGYTEKTLEKAHVSVMEADSTTLLVDSLQRRYMLYDDKLTCVGFQGYIPRREKIVLRAQCKGYETQYLAWSLPKSRSVTRVQATRGIYLWQELEKDLGEASVTASRILMVMKGDTIEYNAAAFRMHEGSMLDNLIRALPGVKLDDNGRITVNGEYVKNLLVNGRDFFDGDPKIALRNLPAYTVNKIKVYRYSDKRKYRNNNQPLSEEEKRKDPLVIDVALKREYAQGWISNYEIGSGSTLKSPFDAKWLGRLFALRYTNHSSLGFYAAVNNVNDDASPGSKGEWSKTEDISSGERKNYTAGINFSLTPKDSPFKFTSSLTAERKTSLFKNQDIGETFYNNSHTSYLSNDISNSYSTNLRWKADLTKHCQGGFSSYNLEASYDYTKNKSQTHHINQQAQMQSDLDTLYTRILWGNAHKKKWAASLNLCKWITTSKNHDFDFFANFSFNKYNNTNSLQDRLLYKQQKGSNLIEQRNYKLPTFNYKYYVRAAHSKYIYKKTFRFHTSSDLEYQQEFHSGHQDLYRSEDDWLAPSAAEISWIIDEGNSYHTTRMERFIYFSQNLSATYKNFGIGLSGEYNVYFRRIRDLRANKTQEKKANNNFINNPNVSLSWAKGKQSINLYGSIRKELPELTYLLDVIDTSNPLFKNEGNPLLKLTKRYRVEANYQYQEQNDYMRLAKLNFGYSEWENSVSYARFYNRTNGITTMRPMNISGTWQTWAKADYSGLMGKMKSWNISNSFKFNLMHNLDYATDDMNEMPSKSAVDNINVSNNMRIDYRIKEIRVGAKVDVFWTKQKSIQKRFADNSFTQFNYGITVSTPIFWNINFATDIMAYYKRGYSDTSMNTTNWVWNAEISRPFGKKKQWIIKAVGFDLLQQIPNVSRSVNAQGWTESRYNTKPSYAMLTITYRLDVKPKQMVKK